MVRGFDEKGQRIAVILRSQEKVQENLHDPAMVTERRDEKTIRLASYPGASFQFQYIDQ